MAAIDELQALSTSGVRAALIGCLFGDDPRPRHAAEIAREIGFPPQSVERELRRLVGAGLVHRGKNWGPTERRIERSEAYERPYRPDPTSRIYLELRRIAMKVRGAAATIREALPEHARLAWITGHYAVGATRPRDPIEVVAIGRPKGLISRKIEKLRETLQRPIRAIVIYDDEWVARLDQREINAQRLRAGAKLWLRGDSGELCRLEKHVREGKELMKSVLATGLDLTDEWDEDYDPDEEARRMRGLSEVASPPWPRPSTTRHTPRSAPPSARSARASATSTGATKTGSGGIRASSSTR